MKDKTTYVRSTKLSTKFLNKEKKQELYNILEESESLCKKFVEYFWFNTNLQNLPKYVGKDIYSKFDSKLSAYVKQCIAKQALGVVKGTFEKQRKRLFVYNKFLKEGKYKKARKLKQIIDKINLSCPEIKNFELQLQGNPTVSRFEYSKSSKEFDCWLYVSLSSSSLNKSYLPLKRTKHFNRWINRSGKLSSGVRISKNFITISFTLEKQENLNKEVKGVDIGIKNIISCSDGRQSLGLEEVQEKLARKKKGSKAFQRAQIERTNFINYCINKTLDLTNTKVVKREDIKNLRKYKRNSRFMQSWTYTDIFGKVDKYCEEQNVSVIKISPTYTSQRCYKCGFVLKSNRNGKEFKCKNCGYTADADLNASKNIALNLQGIGNKERLLHKNRIGFYWNVGG